MPIEVILREHVDHLGDRGEVVKVANGYARNYLLPRKLALMVTEENKRQIARERVKAEVQDLHEVEEARALAATLSTLELAIPRRVGENDILFGSVTSGDLADLLATRDLQVDKRKIMLTEALKTVGDHVVSIKLHRDVVAEVKVKIVPAEG